jgi:hypothetical protein
MKLFKKLYRLLITILLLPIFPILNVEGYGAMDDDVRGMLQDDFTPPEQPTGTEGAPPTDIDDALPIETNTPPMDMPPVETQPNNNDIMSNPLVQMLIQQNQQLMESQLGNTQQPQANFVEPQKTAEEIQAEKEAFAQQFQDGLFENPLETIDKYLEQKMNPIKQELERYQQKESWDNAVESVRRDTANYPGFDEMSDKISEILQQRPHLTNSSNYEEGLKEAYNLAYAEKMRNAPAPQQINPADLVKDPNFLKENVFNNPEVMKMVAMEMAKMQNQSQQVPPMSPSSGVGTGAPYIKERPATYDDLESDIRAGIKQGIL